MILQTTVFIGDPKIHIIGVMAPLSKSIESFKVGKLQSSSVSFVFIMQIPSTELS